MPTLLAVCGSPGEVPVSIPQVSAGGTFLREALWVSPAPSLVLHSRQLCGLGGGLKLLAKLLWLQWGMVTMVGLLWDPTLQVCLFSTRRQPPRRPETSAPILVCDRHSKTLLSKCQKQQKMKSLQYLGTWWGLGERGLWVTQAGLSALLCHFLTTWDFWLLLTAANYHKLRTMQTCVTVL
jgi:hypothetical protein